jgi:HEPN domain-containing protein
MWCYGILFGTGGIVILALIAKYSREAARLRADERQRQFEAEIARQKDAIQEAEYRKKRAAEVAKDAQWAARGSEAEARLVDLIRSEEIPLNEAARRLYARSKYTPAQPIQTEALYRMLGTLILKATSSQDANAYELLLGVEVNMVFKQHWEQTHRRLLARCSGKLRLLTAKRLLKLGHYESANIVAGESVQTLELAEIASIKNPTPHIDELSAILAALSKHISIELLERITKLPDHVQKTRQECCNTGGDKLEYENWEVVTWTENIPLRDIKQMAAAEIGKRV